MFPPTLAYLDSNFTFTDSSDTFSDLQAADATADTIRTSLRRAEDAIVAVLRSFNLERNKRVAVNKLPFEILSSIFESVVGDADHDPRPRLNISHTCTYWRDVATHDPALWTSIDLSHGEGLCRLFAERSQSLTLTLRLAGVYSLPKDHWRDTFWYGEIHRVRSLFLSTGSVAWDLDERPHRWIENTPAESMEELSVVIPARGRGRTHNISDILVGKQSLRYLTMTNIRMPWKPGQYTNLVKLHLVLHDQCNPEGESILHVFHDSPLLEDLLLHFDEAAHLLLDEPREEDDLIPLSRARKIDLDLYPLDMWEILQWVALPEDLPQLRLAASHFRDGGVFRVLPSNPHCIPTISGATTLLIDFTTSCIQLSHPDQPDSTVTLCITTYHQLSPPVLYAVVNEMLNREATAARGPFSTAIIRGTCRRAVDTWTVTRLLMQSDVRIFVLEDCPTYTLDALVAAPGDHELEELRLCRMQLHPHSLMELYGKPQSRLQRVWMRECTFLVDSEDAVHAALLSMSRLGEALRLDAVSYLTPHMQVPSPLTSISTSLLDIPISEDS